MSKIKPVNSISELRYLCNNGDQTEQYKKLAEISAQNLGGMKGNLEQAFRWLETNAMETGSEEGVVDEINFCIDLV